MSYQIKWKRKKADGKVEEGWERNADGNTREYSTKEEAERVVGVWRSMPSHRHTEWQIVGAS